MSSFASTCYFTVLDLKTFVLHTSYKLLLRYIFLCSALKDDTNEHDEMVYTLYIPYIPIYLWYIILITHTTKNEKIEDFDALQISPV